MDIEFKPTVLKQLKHFPKSELKKIFNKIEKLSQDTTAGKQLKGGLSGLLSLRVWPYRIIYQTNNGKITIYSIAHRQSVYKK